jgi:hypothetical protein
MTAAAQEHDDTGACPEECGHPGGACALARAEIHRAEQYAESAWVRAAELGLEEDEMSASERDAAGMWP